MSGDFMAVPDAVGASAGLLVWWELAGGVLLDDMRDAFEHFGWDPKDLPPPPTTEMALSRAMAASLTSKRQLLRPLGRRGAWEVVQERVVPATDEAPEHLEHRRQLVGFVRRDPGAAARAVVEGDEDLVANVRAKLPTYETVLTTTDFSDWLLGRAKALYGVGLRSRGGFYFLPADKLPYWRQVVGVVKLCSGHRMYEIPAMRTEEAVEAILASVVAEAEQQASQVEALLASPTLSTRGVNSSEKSVAGLRGKLAHYAALLGRTAPELEARLVQLDGRVQAARVMVADGGAAQQAGA